MALYYVFIGIVLGIKLGTLLRAKDILDMINSGFTINSIKDSLNKKHYLLRFLK